MNRDTLTVFHELMKKGWIGRKENPLAWTAVQEDDVYSELVEMGKELDFDIYPAGNRLYLVPTMANDLFLKKNMDFRADIGSTDSKSEDLYLMNYLAVYILYSFFKGEGNTLQVQDFTLKDDVIRDFTDHCRTVTTEGPENVTGDEYSENMKKLAENWLGKLEGAQDSKKLNERYGILNKLLIKFRADDLFTEDGQQIRPTEKLQDLMPYVLRKERAVEVNRWLEGSSDAEDH